MPEEQPWRPDRDWLLIVASVALIALGIRSAYVGIETLRHQGIIPF